MRTLFKISVSLNVPVETMMCVFCLFIVMALLLTCVIDATAAVNTFARYREVSRSDSEILHALVFAIQPVNIELLESMLMERTTPGSALYQQWLTFDEIGQLSSTRVGAAAVLNWLTEKNLTIVWTSARVEYIKVEATIGRWEELLGASFSQYEEKDVEERTGHTHVIHRANEYTLPHQIQPHVHSVLNTIQEPLQIHRPPMRQSFPSQFASSSQNAVDIALLRQYYEIDSCSAGPSDPDIAYLQQAVVETADQRFSFEDIKMFQQMHHLPVRAPLDPYGYNTSQCRSTSTNPNPHSYTYESNTSPNFTISATSTSSYFTSLEVVDYPCNEGNLNLQYLMAIAPCVETLFLYVAGDDPFVDWITSFADLKDPPKVFTVPWYSIEQARSADTIDVFNREALKLSLMGVTIIAAAGSSGAANDASYCDAASGPADAAGKGYFPSFPATSPYVTAVGATMGPESGDPEIACQSQLGGVITTGGGFSTYNPTPYWQVDTVNAYFGNLTTAQTPSSGYNPNGRGYPDVSMLGTTYTTVVNGEVVMQYGTEAASAVFAGMVSLINVERARNNFTSVGFLNPTLYQYGIQRNNNWYSSVYRSMKLIFSRFTLFGYFNDITSGNNKCMALTYSTSTTTLTCCKSGFYASKGWDPVTGWGNVPYPALRDMFIPNNSGKTSTSLSGGAIAAIVVGCAVFLLIVWMIVISIQVCLEAYVTNRRGVEADNSVYSDGVLSSNSDHLPHEVL